MVIKKTETFIAKTAGDLQVGDRFRTPGVPPWQEVVEIEKNESQVYDEETNTKKQLVACKCKIDGSIEQFYFTAFTNVEVEILDA
jgi:hypothetical protein